MHNTFEWEKLIIRGKGKRQNYYLLLTEQNRISKEYQIDFVQKLSEN